MKLARAAAALIALIAFILIAVAVVTLRSRSIGDYRPVTATLIAKEPARGGLEPLTRLHLAYEVGGQQHTLVRSVPESSPDATMPIGAKRSIAYDTRQPAHARLSRPSLVLPMTLFGVAAIALAAVGLLVYLSRKPA